MHSIQQFDLSFNKISKFITKNSFKNLSYLDLSTNSLDSDSWKFNFNLKNLTILNVSKTNCDFILNLRFELNSSLTELDLSYNNLSTLNLKYFQNLTNLKILDLESAFLINFEFIYYLNPFLEEINLNNNRLEEDSYFFLKMLLNLKALNLSKYWPFFIYLDP